MDTKKAEPGGTVARAHPYERVLRLALAVVRDRRNGNDARAAHAQLACFALGRMAPTERRVAGALDAAGKALDQRLVVHFVVLGVWQAVGQDPRMATWIGKLIDRALAQCELATFALLLDFLLDAPGFDGALLPAWIDGIRAARERPEARWDLSWFAYRRSALATSAGKTLPWLADLCADPRLLEAAMPADGLFPPCPVCDRLDPLMLSARDRPPRPSCDNDREPDSAAPGAAS